MPATIQVGPYRYTVVCDQALIDHKRTQEEEPHLQGFCSFTQCEIWIAPDRPPDRRAGILLHELLHALFELGGLGDAKNLDSERVVTVIDALLLDTLRRNPDLVAYLMDGGG